jgi:hypothetical protein
MTEAFSQDFLTGETPPFAYYDDDPVVQPLAPRSINGVQTAVAYGGRPYWDNNHTPSVFGFNAMVNLMAVWQSAASPHLDKLGRPGTIPAAITDLRGAEIEFKCMTKSGVGFHLPKTGRIGLWIQSYDPKACGGKGGYVNQFNVRSLICEQMGVARQYKRRTGEYDYHDIIIDRPTPVTCTVPVTDDEDDWIVLPPRPDQMMNYGWKFSKDVIRNWSHNMGILHICDDPIELPRGDHPAVAARDYPKSLGYGGSEFWIDKFTIRLPS